MAEGRTFETAEELIEEVKRTLDRWDAEGILEEELETRGFKIINNQLVFPDHSKENDSCQSTD